MNINSILSAYGSNGIFPNYGITNVNTSILQNAKKSSEVDSYQPSEITTFMSKDMYDYSSNFSKLSKLKNEINSVNTSQSLEVTQETNSQAPSSASGSSAGKGGSSNSEGETKTEIKNINGQLYKVVTTTYEDGTTETTTTAIGNTKTNDNNGEVSDTANLVDMLMM